MFDVDFSLDTIKEKFDFKNDESDLKNEKFDEGRSKLNKEIGSDVELENGIYGQQGLFDDNEAPFNEKYEQPRLGDWISLMDDAESLNDAQAIIDKVKISEVKQVTTFGLSSHEILEEMSPEERESEDQDRQSKLDKYVPSNNGTWTGEKGNSTWQPDGDYIPQKNNPDNLSWGELLDNAGVDGFKFENGEVDFSEVSEATVEIENFSNKRDENFAQADKKLAEELDITPEEARQYRKDNNLTWHERSDMKTMDLVPSVINSNVSHAGGFARANDLAKMEK
ncbi:HNH endonuclease [Periweissella fabalis]|uniref:Uncharacterized protein n=1 Tax=Periweissella fabalis TaxID=1070421 RepID=A0A7X6S2T2_9LACO|nr:HNH endonuclease [Periweissella fabalis]MCM0599157.1 HNH endonuclease [Periweissella fabalis]NKZ23436.1 hypothetical protein [Periweissella fabalis]